MKRLPVKYIRDRAKSRYKKDSDCYVCATQDDLQFHHLQTVDILFNNWINKKGIVVNTTEDILGVRDEFITDHEYEMYEDTVTLCGKCHKKLHALYGQKPLLSTAPKQRRWLEIQHNKL